MCSHNVSHLVCVYMVSSASVLHELFSAAAVVSPDTSCSSAEVDFVGHERRRVHAYPPCIFAIYFRSMLLQKHLNLWKASCADILFVVCIICLGARECLGVGETKTTICVRCPSPVCIIV